MEEYLFPLWLQIIIMFFIALVMLIAFYVMIIDDNGEDII